MRDLTPQLINQLREREREDKALFLTEDARKTFQIEDNCIDLLVTSPPFLNVVQYSNDNWLRCWFNNINVKQVEKKISTPRSLGDWKKIMGTAFQEFHRILKPNGYIAFEVGEVRKNTIRLDEHVVPLGIQANLACLGIVVHVQEFTKTAAIWGVDSNGSGTNNNRIVLFQKKA